ncbi:MAG: polyprenyl synthetase family protein [Syntrophotaleaceae bacterium]
MEKMMAEFLRMKDYVDLSLAEYIPNREPLLNVLVESINYTLYSGGKRVRPIFSLIVGEMFGVPMERMKSLACSVEMIHTASLIMDDLPHMDDAAVRRGKTANHLLYGQDVASLASIALLTRAYEVVLADPDLPADKKVLVVEKLANTVGLDGLVGGQFVDLKFANETINKTVVEYIYIHKTASLFVASGTTAAIIGNAEDVQIRALETYAENLGSAFQIFDDLLNTEGNEQEMGKSLHANEKNYVTLHGVAESKKAAQEHVEKAIKAISIFEGKNAKLIALCKMLMKRKS